ncbi:hypothetical protein GCK72_010503 [Caenorhabditis remanei]|uniref:G-protein coupled receptors family 1 profile domain-containing protein n=1 Tax=Caenorhabditis remanei TaxID=31234 RepID=A0A6A5H5M4_CAERE|nr:hypothetical protein GCK72_010503 [Caenorhabditis remanei]KAF1762241.1 hypothetical protein GCK72_010503 [Caenorhabditis remanei]
MRNEPNHFTENSKISLFEMASLPEQPRNAYLPIGSFPEYQKFSYQFDYVTIIILLAFICLVPSIYSTLSMMIFHQRNLSRNFSKEIHQYVFKSFVCMQSCNIISTILDFVIIRIPCTSLVTSYFSTMKLDSLMRFVIAACYGFEYLAQLFTILFCFIRVLVLYHPRKHLEASLEN